MKTLSTVLPLVSKTKKVEAIKLALARIKEGRMISF